MTMPQDREAAAEEVLAHQSEEFQAMEAVNTEPATEDAPASHKRAAAKEKSD
jgi:hypothetical protein